MSELQHVLDWEHVQTIKNDTERKHKETELLNKWMEEQRWSTIIFGYKVTGQLEKLMFMPDNTVVFIITEVIYGNKVLSVQGPYEAFLPVEEEI